MSSKLTLDSSDFLAALASLQSKLGYRFGDVAVLVQAMTHKSYGYEHLQDQPVALRDNERLEFLGDAVLDLALSDYLLEAFPNANEGHLSRARAAVVNEKTLARLASSIQLQKCLRLGKGELQTGGQHKSSILSCAFEALVAAIYLDGGFKPVYNVIRTLFSPFFEGDQSLNSFYDHKTQLQELIQAKWKSTPTYSLAGEEGPDHAKEFDVEVRLKEKVLARASGASKKEAEQRAAKKAIEDLSLQ